MSYVRCSILGTIGTEEVWSINAVFDPTGEIEGSTNQAALDAAALAIANISIPTNLRTAMSSAVARNGCRLEVRSDSGDDLLAISQAGSTTAQSGTGSVYLPPQTAMVLSLRTNTPGASGRGRLYWPGMGLTLNNLGRITTPAANNFVTDFKTYLQGMESALATAFPTIGFDLAVRSKVTQSTPHVVRIQAGNVPDVQRRRRDTIPESYSSVDF